MIGVDEVGRGCWAGPLLVVAARPTAGLPDGLKDSKLLSKLQREKLLDLLSICCDFGEGWVQPAEIDQNGLARALKIGVKRALNNLKAGIYDEIIMDGKVNYLPKKFINATVLVEADNLVPAVSAASIYAKVTRDKYMSKLAERFPGYGFESHAGYGTKVHIQALQTRGLIKTVHRYSYAPIANLAAAA